MNEMIASMRAELEHVYDMGDCSTTQDKIQALTSIKEDIKPDNFAIELDEPELVIVVIRAVLDYEIDRLRKTLITAV